MKREHAKDLRCMAPRYEPTATFSGSTPRSSQTAIHHYLTYNSQRRSRVSPRNAANAFLTSMQGQSTQKQTYLSGSPSLRRTSCYVPIVQRLCHRRVSKCTALPNLPYERPKALGAPLSVSFVRVSPDFRTAHARTPERSRSVRITEFDTPALSLPALLLRFALK